MTNPVLSALEQGAIPTAIVSLEAVKQFITDLGPDPLKFPLTFPGAQLKLMGTLQLQIPALAGAENAALMGAANSQFDSWIATLKAAQTPTP